MEANTDTVRRVQLSNKEVILCGTAHISKESVLEVEKLIREEKPERVCIEIDEGRYKSFTEGSNWSSLNIGKVLKSGKAFLLLANLVLSSYQRRLGMDVGTTQGMEMKAAVDVAGEMGIPFSFVDRNIQTTLGRAWAKSGFFQKIKLLGTLVGSAFSSEKLTEDELESLKKQSALQTMMEELADYLPAVKEVLIDERDQFQAVSIFRQKESRIVAVVGAGHMDGMVKWLEKLDSGEESGDLEAINTVPKKKSIVSFIPWIITFAVAGLIISGFVRSGFAQGIEMLSVWIIVNGTLASLGALCALAHPVTIIVSFAAAPITSMNPTVGVGLVAGLVQAWAAKPRVRDFENLHDDISSFKGFYKNRLTKVLLVFLFSSIGSTIGTFAAFPYLAGILAG